MRWLLFLARLAFICGFCFVLALASLFYKQIENTEWLQTLIVIGFVIGAIVIPIYLLCYLVLAGAGKKPRQAVPLWITLGNFLFLLVLITYIFYLNDPYYFKR